VKILIVEDNDEMCRMIKSILSDLCEQICECSDGADAAELYARHRPDWVLMDVKMPRVDGITATRQIKETFPDARIMIVSDYGDRKIREAARKAGASEFVVKENLFEIRRILLEDRQKSDAAQPREADSLIELPAPVPVL
jgi:CheY-like chemotaxis protein